VPTGFPSTSTTDPLSGYTPDWRQRVGANRDPLADYAPNWRSVMPSAAPAPIVRDAPRTPRPHVRPGAPLLPDAGAFLQPPALTPGQRTFAQAVFGDQGLTAPRRSDVPIDTRDPRTIAAEQRKLRVSLGVEEPRLSERIPGTIGDMAEDAANLTRGVASGILNRILGTTDRVVQLVETGAALARTPMGTVPVPTTVDPIPGLTGFRQRIAEAQQIVTEKAAAEGRSGTVGEFIGALAGGTPQVAVEMRLMQKAVLAGAPTSQLARMVRAGQFGPYLQRVASEVVPYAPISAVQGAIQGGPLGTAEDPLEGALLQIVTDVATGAIFEGVREPGVRSALAAQAGTSVPPASPEVAKETRRGPPEPPEMPLDASQTANPPAGAVPMPPPAQTPHATGAPGRVQRIERMPVAAIEADPTRFQFKSAVDESGAGRELKGVQRWNDRMAGVVSVWKDPDTGRTFVVNGHHRLELAKRLGVEELNVQFLDEADAVSARAAGTLINLAEGRGTAVDVAKFLRDRQVTPDQLVVEGISLRGELADNGLALSRLAPDLFDAVATGKLPQSYGVAIGRLLDDPVLQREAVTAIQRGGKRLSEAEVTEVARQVRDAGVETVTQETLFGEEADRKGLYVERAQLAANLKKRVSGDRRLFGFVAKEGRAEALTQAGETKIDVEAAKGLAEKSSRAEEVFDRLYTRSGPLADLVTEGARRIARGEKPSAVVADLYPAIGEAVARELESLPGGAGVDQADGGERAGTQEGGVIAPEPGSAGERTTGDFGQTLDSTDPDQSGLFSPRRPTVQHPTGERDLFGTPLTETVEAQTSLLGEQEGTAATRSLREAEAAARADLDALRQRFAAETDPLKRAELARAITEREKLVNRDQAISAEELQARAAAEDVVNADLEPGPDQPSLFSPANQSGPLSQKLRSLLGRKLMTPQAHAEVKARIDIGRKLAEDLEAVMRQGRFDAKRRQALGVFKPKEEVSRVVRFDMLDTVAHEIGHFISQKYLRNPANRGAAARGGIKLSKPALRELVQMGKNLYGSRKPAGGYGEEGIAEFFSFYVTEPQRLQAEAPTFLREIEPIFKQEPFIKDALDQAQQDFAIYRQAPAAARIDAMLSIDERVRWRPSATGFVKAMVDDLEEIRVAVRDLDAKTPSSSPTVDTRNAYTLARLTRGSAGASEEMLKRGVIKHGTDLRVTRGLEEVLYEVGRKNIQDFRRYLIAASALERWENGINPGIARADAEAIVKRDGPRFRAHAEEIWKIGQALIDMRVDVGLLSPEAAALIKSKNQSRVAFYRVFAPEETAASKGWGRPFGRNTSGVKSQKGSARRIIDPLESVVRDVYHTVDQSRRHEAAAVLVAHAQRTQGGGMIAEEVAAPKRPIKIPLEQIQQQLADLGLVYTGIDANGQPFIAPLGGPGGKQLTGLLEAFEDLKVAGPAEAADLIIPIVQGGERKWFQIKDADLYKTIQGMNREQLTMWWRLASIPTRTLRAGATLTAEFIVRNPGRDAWASAIYSKAGFRIPGAGLTEGLFHALKADEVFQRWKLNGGEHAALLGLDRPQVQKHFKDFMASPVRKLVNVILRPIDTLRLLSATLENATRIGEFGALERKLLREGKTPRDAATAAAFGSRDVTQDFAKAGTAGRSVNMLVEFFNASVGGTEKLLRELKTRPHVVLPRALAAITLPSLGLYWAQRDDPEYRDTPSWVRDAFWVWVERGDDQTEGWDGYGRGKVERVWMFPKPFELGVLFGTVPERIMERIYSEDPQSLASLDEALVRAFVPNFIPTVFKPILENFANKSTFLDRPIVPRGRENLAPAEQSVPRTGETARLIGRAVDYSPAKIENLVRGYTGGLGQYALDAADAGVRTAREVMGKPSLKGTAESSANRDKPTAAKVPAVRAFVRGGTGTDAEGVEQFYNAWEDAERHRLTLRAMYRDGRAEDAVRYYEEHRQQIDAAATSDDPGGTGMLRRFKNEVDRLQDLRRHLEYQPDTPENRNARQRVIEAIKRTSRDALKALNGGQVQ
jgi:hypothetical protein